MSDVVVCGICHCRLNPVGKYTPYEWAHAVFGCAHPRMDAEHRAYVAKFFPEEASGIPEEPIVPA